jgi:hypothetical protein
LTSSSASKSENTQVMDTSRYSTINAVAGTRDSAANRRLGNADLSGVREGYDEPEYEPCDRRRQTEHRNRRFAER